MKNIQLTREDIKNYGLDKDKLQTLTYPDRYFFRPISDTISASLFNKFNLSPNKISILSLFITFIGFVLICYGDKLFAIIGTMFLIIWAVLDCADGSIARTLYYKYNIKNPLGEFFDALAGYFVVGGLWFSLGLYLYFQNNEEVWIILGSLSSIFGLYARVSYVKLAAVKCKNGILEKEDSRKSFVYFIYENLEFGSFLLPIVLVSIIFNLLDFILLFYLLVNFAMLLWLFKHIYHNSKIYTIGK